MKRVWRNRLTTVFPCQGHYALDPRTTSMYLQADLTIEGVGDVCDLDMVALMRPHSARPPE